MKRKEMIRKIVLSSIALVLVFVAVFSGLQILEATVSQGGKPSSDTAPSKTIVRDGVEYFPRQDITVVMLLGIDKFGPVEASDSYTNDGAADMIALLIFDEVTKECSILQLNRDTMLDVSILGVRGEYAGTVFGQLALAHTYGSGMEDSSENVKNTLEKFLLGMTVDHYVTMHMDAIGVLNDGVGGVTVNVVDDFSLVDPTIQMGEMTLMGEQAIHYVRARKDVGDQKNTSRMQRQKEYLDRFLEALNRKEQESLGTLIDLYDKASAYMVTDCSAETMSSLLDRFNEYELTNIVAPEGENRVVDGHYQFHVNEEKLDELILDLFYRPKK